MYRIGHRGIVPALFAMALLAVMTAVTPAQAVTFGFGNITNNSGTLDPSGLGVFVTRVNTTSDGEKLLDNLVVSQTFAEVVPEPSALVLAALALFALPRQRRIA